MTDPRWYIIQATDPHQAEACFALSQTLSLASVGGVDPSDVKTNGFLLGRETVDDYRRACHQGHLWRALDPTGAMAGYLMAWRVGGREPQHKNPRAGVVWQAGVAPPFGTATVPTWVYVDKVAVAPCYQRQGVGQALYQAVPPQLAGHPTAPVGAFVVHAPVRNEASIRFHQQLGFGLLAEGREGGFQLGFYWRASST